MADELIYTELQEGSAEYMSVVAILEGLDDIKLLKKLMFIEKVSNTKMNEAYNGCTVDNEQYLLHGTSPDNGASIEQTGLTVKKSKRALFGVGNYFTSKTSTVMGYMPVVYDYRQCYLCRVKLGKHGCNHNGDKYSIYCAYTDQQSTILYRIGFMP